MPISPAKLFSSNHSSSKGSTSLSILVILGIILAFAAFLSGFFATTLSTPADNAISPVQVADQGSFCCNSGTTCQKGKHITFRGTNYSLLVSSFYSSEHNRHFNYTGENATNADGSVLADGKVYNLYQGDAHENDASCKNHQDQGLDTFNQAGGGCYTVPTGTFIFVCRSGDTACQDQSNGSRAAVWDAYIKSDAPIPPQVISCQKRINPNDSPMPTIGVATGATNGSPASYVTPPNIPAQRNLQLRTFGVTQAPPQLIVREPFIADALSPFCKPAIYLYPPQAMPVHVEVAPKGPLTVTIPLYPQGGWNVMAYPGSQIQYQNMFYPYLYYEAKLPDSLAQKPQDGYVIASEKLSSFLPPLLEKLGLNDTERKAFVEYWTKSLPKSPLYFVGVMQQSVLDEAAPLTIIPRPDSTVRVTLYFQALDHPETVTAPILTPVTRTGFTAVEWGGIFKRDKNHTFSCFM